MQYTMTEIFKVVENGNFQKKIFDNFLIFALKHRWGYTFEPPRRGSSNEYPQSMFWRKNKKTRNWLQARLSVYPPQNYLELANNFLSQTCRKFVKDIFSAL